MLSPLSSPRSQVSSEMPLQPFGQSLTVVVNITNSDSSMMTEITEIPNQFNIQNLVTSTLSQIPSPKNASLTIEETNPQLSPEQQRRNESYCLKSGFGIAVVIAIIMLASTLISRST